MPVLTAMVSLNTHVFISVNCTIKYGIQPWQSYLTKEKMSPLRQLASLRLFKSLPQEHDKWICISGIRCNFTGQDRKWFLNNSFLFRFSSPFHEWDESIKLHTYCCPLHLPPTLDKSRGHRNWILGRMRLFFDSSENLTRERHSHTP